MSIQLIQDNKSVRHDYHIIKTFEAGLVLMGSEVKAIRERSIQLKDSYISFKAHEAFLQIVGEIVLIQLRGWSQ